jgi:tetratricopeptide (TPR) repeat protein
LSWVRYQDRDYKEAEKEINRAIQIDPQYALAHATYSYYLSLWGKVEEAVEQNRIAVQLEPATRMFVTHAGYPHLTARRYDQAISEFRNALVLDQNYRYARDWIAHVYEDIGRITEAISESEKADILSGAEIVKVKEKHDALRRAYADGGAPGYWLIKRELERSTVPPEDMACDTAAFHAHLGQKAEALDWLEKAYAEGSCTDWLLMDPCWHGLRDEPRFHTLLKKIGLEK